MRVSEALEGATLPADKRESLLRLARILGLRAFDANLVIAIVQDQARQGYPPQQCPGAGEAQLRMVARHAGGPDRRRRLRLHLTALFALLAVELVALVWLLTP